MRRVRYQVGSLTLNKKKQEWTFRYYQTDQNGNRRYRRVFVGTKEQYLTETAARLAVDQMKLSINGTNSKGPVLFGAVIKRYKDEELPDRFSTRSGYLSMLKTRIEPQWSSIAVVEIRTLQVERWLKSLRLAPKTKTNLRNIMHRLFQSARRWELIDNNPIELVRQSSRRQKTPRRLSAGQFQGLLNELSQPCRNMAILAACLGLRIGEILGLQWGDIDLDRSTLTISRSVYQWHVGPAKTSYSEASLPLAGEIVAVLSDWHAGVPYRSKTNWVFASDKGGLINGDRLRAEVLQPAATRAKIGKIGWHDLRHSFATALDTAGARMKTAQALMRHANIATTMDIYTGAVEKDKREAVGLVAKSFLGTNQTEQRPYPTQIEPNGFSGEALSP